MAISLKSLAGLSSSEQTESRLFTVILVGLCLAMVATHVLQVWKLILPSGQFKNLHLGFALLIAYCSLAEKSPGRTRRILFGLAALAALIPFAYIHFEFEALVDERTFGPIDSDIVIGVLLIILTSIATVLKWGWSLPVFSLLALGYGYFGYLFGGELFYHSGISFERLISYASIPFFQGLLGSLTGVSGTMVFIFMLFAGLLKTTGGIDFIMNLARVCGGWTRSGPAQIAVFSSGFMGMISGSTVANVASTGSITIPMMIRYGFRPEQAGAIEAVASTGGQFAPPVMGLTAFLIVGITGIPYSTVVLAAIFPALIYYLNLAVAVHLHTLVKGIGLSQPAAEPGRQSDEKSGGTSLAREMLLNLHLLIGIAILIYLLMIQMPPAYSGLWALLTIVCLEMVKQTILSPRQPLAGLKLALVRIIRGLDDGARSGAMLALAIATIGILVDILIVTGFAQKLSHLMLGLAGNRLWLLLILTAVACFVFGLGMPTPAAYALVAVLGAPALTDFGVQLLTAHMLVFFFANMSALTPPVAVAALVASNLSGGRYVKTSLTAVKLGLPGFMLPFIFAYRPELLMLEGSLSARILCFGIVLIGFVVLNLALTGFFLSRLRAWERLVMLAGSLTLFIPYSWWTWLGGAALVLVLILSALRSRATGLSESSAA